MRVYDYVTDADVATPTVEGRVEDPWVSAVRVWYRGNHGYARCTSYTADVGRKDVAEEIDFTDSEEGTYIG
jgi:hypothetical protein